MVAGDEAAGSPGGTWERLSERLAAGKGAAPLGRQVSWRTDPSIHVRRDVMDIARAGRRGVTNSCKDKKKNDRQWQKGSGAWCGHPPWSPLGRRQPSGDVESSEGSPDSMDLCLESDASSCMYSIDSSSPRQEPSFEHAVQFHFEAARREVELLLLSRAHY